MSDERPGDAGTVLDFVEQQTRTVLEVYRVDPGMVQEHANNERRIAQGGYGDRQIYELVQNAADELRDDPGGEISVVLTGSHLYCANQGSPLTAVGAETILRMSVSRKRGGQIGRFGVGVKSVLAVSDHPQFFSHERGRPFGFGFDRDWSEGQIRRLRPETAHAPVLRMAMPLDPERTRSSDPVLDELLGWATTVVRLPLRPGAVERLARDLRTFPVEFPLFSPHVGVISLEDRRARVAKRQLFQRVDGPNRTIEEGRPDGTTLEHRWKVFTRTHHPSDGALAAAGELHDRPDIDISWAVPAQSGQRGLFWAYFPTKFATTLRGILNAPWKTSEDRQAIFDGNAFNNELLEKAADLVVGSLPLLSEPGDPAAYIDYLPGRGREAPQFADERLTAEIWKAAGSRPSVVDQDGALRRPEDLGLHPEGLTKEMLALWATAPGRPSNWVHRSAETRDRRSRVALMYQAAGQSGRTVRQWLEALVHAGDPTASGLAIRICAALQDENHALAEDALRARIVLTEDGRLVAPGAGTIFRRTVTENLDGDLVYVDQRVVEGFGVDRALTTLGINEADAAGRLTAVADQGFRSYGDEQWRTFWRLSRVAGSATTADVLRQRPTARAQLCVLTLAGIFRPLSRCLAPGPVVPADGTRDAEIAVDPVFHSPDTDTLAQLGLLTGPRPSVDPRAEDWFEEYRESGWKAHVRTLPPTASRPQVSTMRVDGSDPAGPLHFLRRLSEDGRAAYLENLPRAGLIADWTVQVGRQQTTRKNITSPLVWMGRNEGYLHTSLGLRRVRHCVGPALNTHASVLPVAAIREDIATVLRLPAALDRVPVSLWESLLADVQSSTDDATAGRLYALFLARDLDWPEEVGTRCRVGDEWRTDVPDGDIVVTESREDYDELVREQVPALLVDSAADAALLVERWEMLRPAQRIEKELRFVPESEPEGLLDLYPSLKIKRRAVEGWSLTRCSELERVTRSPRGQTNSPVARATQDRSVLVLRPADDLEALRAVDLELALGLGEPGCRHVMENRRKQRESARVREVRRSTSVPEKLVTLLGEEELRTGLPQGLAEAESARRGRDLSGGEIAQLAVDAHGSGVLRQHQRRISAVQESAPRSFTGGRRARQFVDDLGLPERFAGSSIPAPPEVEEVPGPSDFPRLHRYQETLAEATKHLLLDATPRRAMLRLPTGAGKTRVAVEAVIRVVRERSVVGPILWIAESNELCEQAVQSWKFVWSKVGPPSPLTISRFWGGNDVVPVRENVHLVVATDATLGHHLGRDDLGWLRSPAVVLVDEAHRAITPSYTAILEQLGLTAHRTDRPLIGLTATPYRGRNEVETGRLVERFGRRRLDEGLFGDEDASTALQREGVLARVEHRELPGATLRLSDDELAQVDRMNFAFLPTSAETKLGLDTERNEVLLGEIEMLPAGWPVLLFAISVSHAQLLAGLLNARGIPAASIDGSTPAGERRSKIEDYRTGRIRVLTNYGVLAQGFDAPTTRVVVIARPTYSPNVYQQMIGRGLRGPLNGGSEKCLILDVGDNIENFGATVAWSGFEHLWAAPS